MPFLRESEGMYLAHADTFVCKYEAKSRPFSFGVPKNSYYARKTLEMEIGRERVDALTAAYRRSNVSHQALLDEVSESDSLRVEDYAVSQPKWRATKEKVRTMFKLPVKGQPLHLNNLKLDAVKSTLPMTNSPGLPYTDEEVHKKGDILDDGEMFDKLRSQIRTIKTTKRKASVPPALVSIRNHVVPADAPDKVRGVYGYPMMMWAIETLMFWDLIQKFKVCPTSYGIGITPLKGGGLAKYADSYFKLMTDFSSFDKTVGAFLIREAFDILEDNIDFGHYRFGGIPDMGAQFRLFDLCVDYFINTPLVLPTGEGFQKCGGVPSGSVVTNLIDSIVNALVTVYVTTELGVPLSRERYKFSGDDALLVGRTTTVRNTDFDPDKYSKLMYDCFGIICVPSKTSITASEDFEFLGYKQSMKSGGPHRDPVQLVAALVLPESTDRHVHDYCQRLVGLSYAGATSPKFRELCLALERRLFAVDALDGHVHWRKGMARYINIIGLRTEQLKRCCTTAS